MDKYNGLLKDNDMDILETWIGTGPKMFKLLYKISRDGCTPAKFHEKCDGQGATVTVLYNSHCTVYGGYISKSWSSPSSSGHATDEKAFLFQLKYNDILSRRKCPLKQNRTGNAFYNNSGYGPTFGDYSLCAYASAVDNSGGTFALNGSVNIGSAFDFQGLSNDQYNNNTMAVTDLEVYKVLDGERNSLTDTVWRKSKTWNAQNWRNCLSETKTHRRY